MSTESNLVTRVVTFIFIGGFLVAAIACGKSSRDNPDRRSRFEERQRRANVSRGGTSNSSSTEDDADENDSPATPSEPVAIAGGSSHGVRLIGATVTKSTDGQLQPIAQVKINFLEGLNSLGQPTSSDVKPQPKLTANGFASYYPFEESDKVIANFGCSIESVRKVVGHQPIKSFKEAVKQAGNHYKLTAKMIFVCGDAKSGFDGLFITTETLVLNNATLLVEEETKSDSMITALWVEAENLVLNGTNKITLHHLKFADYESAPELELNTNKLSGQGTLEIESRGTDYNAADVAE